MQLNLKAFETFPVLKTKRLMLRQLQLQDAEQVYAMRSNSMVNRFIARDSMGAIDNAAQLVARTNEAYNNKQAIAWAGLLRDGSRIIGACGLNNINPEHLSAEIGGEMTTEYWGKHLAIEAVAAIIQYGLCEMNLHRIDAKVDPNNRGAIYLMELLGFKKEAHLKDRIFFKDSYRDMAIYALLKGEEKLQPFL